MEYVERLAQEATVNNERNVGLRGTLCAGNDADTAAAKRAEQLTGNTRCVLHVFAHDGNGCQSTLCLHGEHGTRLYLLGKLLVEHLDGSCCIFVAHTDRSRIL